MRAAILYVCIVLAGAAGIAAYAIYSRPAVVEIHMSAEGFAPKKISIRKGDTVRFFNDSQHKIQPASDAHPTHGLYPEFDAIGGIDPGNSWDFTFEKAGVWRFHDHRNAGVGGVVTVIGRSGEAKATCLALSSGEGTSPECYAADLLSTLDERGIEAAFDLVRDWYASDPTFPVRCHDVLHLLGPAAYHQYESDKKAVIRPETSYCGYGFYHGFMEEMIFSLGHGPVQYKEVNNYCEMLSKTDANRGASCYHGVGHAMFDSLDGDYWGDDMKMAQMGLRYCFDAFSEDSEGRVQCAGGVFNSLGTAYQNQSYNLKWNEADPVHVCKKQEKKYQPNCYLFVGVSAVIRYYNEAKDALPFIRSIEDPASRAKVLFGWITNRVRLDIKTIDLSVYAKECDSYPSYEEREACTRGVASGLHENGNPGEEYKKMYDFCEFLNGSLRDWCTHWTFVTAGPDLR